MPHAGAEDKGIQVVGAAIVKEGRILCAQRGASKSLAGYWEFPGGKIEEGESPEQALYREIEEELLCQIEVGEKVCTSRYEYDFGAVTLTTFLCKLSHGEPQKTEHQELRWLSADQLRTLQWAPVDSEAVSILSSAGQGAQ